MPSLPRRAGGLIGAWYNHAMVESTTRRRGARKTTSASAFAPPRPAASLLERTALQQRLARAQGHLWVHGPAGCGKTTAMAQMVHGRRPQALWLRLDAMDRDAAVWFDRVTQLFCTDRASVGASPLRYGPEHAHDLGRFARHFFRSLWSGWSATRVWVLDDVHELAAEAQEAVLPVLLQEAPEGLTVVLVGRSAPVAGTARAVANRQLTIVGPQELRFSDAEAVALFAREVGDSATPAQARDWCQAFDGWAAGLVAACTALQRPGFDASQPAAQGLESVALLQYLAAEGFAHLHAPEQSVLLCTAFMGRFTAAHAGALAACDGSQALLNGLLRHQGFLEASPPYYRVHAVFRRFLQTLWQPGSARTAILRHSASLLEGDGQWLEAAQLWAALGDAHAHADLVQRLAPRLLAQGQGHGVVQMIRAREPDAAARDGGPAHGRVLFWLAQALSETDAAQAGAVAREALQHCTLGADAVGAFLATGTLLTLLRTQRTELPDALALAQRCERDYLCLRDGLAPELQPYAAGAYIAALSTQHHGAAIDSGVLVALLDALQADTNPQMRLRWLTVLHEQCYIRQDPVHVHRLETLAQTLCAHPLVRDAARMDWWVELARARVYQRRLAQADAALDQADALLQRLDDTVVRCHVQAWRLIVRCRQGRARECQHLLLSNQPQFSTVPVLVRATVHWAEGNWHLYAQQYPSALEQFDAAIHCYALAGASPEQGPMIWLGQSLARLNLGYHDGALQSLQPLLQSTVGGMSRARLQAYALAVQACVAIARGTPDAADLLPRCWSALRETDYRDAMQGGDSWVAELCARALQRGIEVEFVDAVVRHRQLPAPGGAPQCWPYPVRIHCLGDWVLHTGARPASERELRTSLELLHRVLAQAPAPLPIDELIGDLWPGEGREGAQKAFDAALHRLRKRLGCEDALRLAQRQLSLHPGWVWADVIALEQRLDEAGSVHSGGTAALVFCEDVLGLYRGHLLPDLDHPAVLQRRSVLWLRVRSAVESALKQANDCDGVRLRPLVERLQQLHASAPWVALAHT